MATRGPYRTLDLATKVEVLKEVDQGGTAKQDIARKYGIKPNTLSTFIKNKRSILDAFESEKFKTSRKRMRTGAYPELEEALLIWIREARNNKLPLSGEVVTAKASSLAEMLGINDFAASDGWLTRFKHRHDLIFKSVCAEKASVDDETCLTWKAGKLREYLENTSRQTFLMQARLRFFIGCYRTRPWHLKTTTVLEAKEAKRECQC
uniref:Putative tick transposon n=1 Tax=Rhipicephalus microplus TaxID=6941 RepID=A0A6G5AAD3_RHIMP